ncbi:integration host factor subunit alpha [Entomobacter blattae]|uniref:Integration host factor subunit alpha n=1 Tax=Entomobacter blattae TaxID=2762277 RepID=A0A7H1NST9_9PROT|nr:integration host factor subunit alpha [Entomobacter blattae]QNT78849.1 Integration host factor subunit alpha [Entomobacter blattae]
MIQKKTETLTRIKLVERIHSQVGLSQHDSMIFLERILELIAQALEANESVKISGFGTFLVRKKKERIGRNPKTKEEVPIRAHTVLIFRPSQVLKARINHKAEGDRL